jgi:hypothetical protein
MELQNAVVAFRCGTLEKTPKFCIYDTQKEGYVLYIKTSSVNTKCLDFLKNLVNSRRLGIRESEDYLIIYGY